jgi:hypothetical protein
MGSIYKNAVKVHLCVGPSTHDSDFLFGCINRYLWQKQDVAITLNKQRRLRFCRLSAALGLDDVHFEHLNAADSSKRRIMFCGETVADSDQFRDLHQDLAKICREMWTLADERRDQRHASTSTDHDIYRLKPMAPCTFDTLTLHLSSRQGNDCFIDLVRRFSQEKFRCANARDRAYSVCSS